MTTTLKTLDDLTPEILAKIPTYIENGTAGVFDGGRYEEFTYQGAVNAVNWNYSKCDFKLPIVLVTENIYETQLVFNYLNMTEKFHPILDVLFDFVNNTANISDVKKFDMFQNVDENKSKELITEELASILTKSVFIDLDELLKTTLSSDVKKKLFYSNSTYLFTLNVYSDCYYQWFKFIKDEFKIPLSIEDEFEECFTLQRKSGVFSAIFSDMACVVSKYPKKVNRNEESQLHSLTEPACIWGASIEATKFDLYYINGRSISKDVFLSVLDRTYTFKDFSEESNEDVRAGVIQIIRENFGNNGVIDFLDATVIDECNLTHASGVSETLKLWKTRNKLSFLVDADNNQGEYMYWLEMKCPTTGTIYMVDSLPEFTTALEAAKAHRPAEVPVDLEYNFTHFNS